MRLAVIFTAISGVARPQSGGEGPAPASLDFSDAANGQYLYLLLEEWVM